MKEVLAGYFTDGQHEPFSLPGEGPAALLVHGFPGTPAEMRPLAELLHAAGWSTHGLLLPGFGPQIETVFQREAEEWLDSVSDALQDLRGTGRRVVLVGYSFGAMVSLNAAVRVPADAIVLIAPFWKMAGARMRLIWPLLKRIFPEIQPFRRMDFSSWEVRSGIENMLPGIDLDDPEVQAALRELTVPAGFIDRVAQLGRRAREAAGGLHCPVLIIQGRQDEVSDPRNTEELGLAFPVPPETLLVDAGHDLLAAGTESLAEAAQKIQDFGTKRPS